MYIRFKVDRLDSGSILDCESKCNVCWLSNQTIVIQGGSKLDFTLSEKTARTLWIGTMTPCFGAHRNSLSPSVEPLLSPTEKYWFIYSYNPSFSITITSILQSSCNIYLIPLKVNESILSITHFGIQPRFVSLY